ncbi:hypothetical protein IWX48DRAFT_611424 [Phyllosticta citricarpa]
MLDAWDTSICTPSARDDPTRPWWLDPDATQKILASILLAVGLLAHGGYFGVDLGLDDEKILTRLYNLGQLGRDGVMLHLKVGGVVVRLLHLFLASFKGAVHFSTENLQSLHP